MNFEPNWASSPGNTVVRLMCKKGISHYQMAERMELDQSAFNEFLNGNIEISNYLAEILSTELGSSKQFWLNRYTQFKLDLKRLHKDSNEPVDDANWAEKFPIKSMKEFGWIPDVFGSELKSALLSFFSCSDTQHWRSKYEDGIGKVAFRTSFSFAADEHATLTWLRCGELENQAVSFPNYQREKFIELLPRIKRLSAFKHPNIFFPKLKIMCANVGVAISSARCPEGCRASGASWIDEKNVPHIHLSFRYLSEDHFWFTFFHEAAHVILHGGQHIDVDGADPSFLNGTDKEAEANTYASELLVEKEIWRHELLRKLTKVNVKKAARLAEITPGILIGQMQKRGIIEQNKFNYFKRRYRWDDSSKLPILNQPRK